MAGFNLDDYVSVDERVQIFYKTFKDGRLQTREVRFCEWPQPGILAVAEAYRSPDDPHPGVGTAWEPVPGKTQFTRDSEVQNAETAAWGRAIVACGIGSKPGQIASREEVAARQPDPTPRSAPAGTGKAQQPAAGRGSAKPNGELTPEQAEHKRAHDTLGTADLKLDPADRKVITQLQRKRLWAIASEVAASESAVRNVVMAVTGQDSTAKIPRWLYDRVIDEIKLVGQASNV